MKARNRMIQELGSIRARSKSIEQIVRESSALEGVGADEIAAMIAIWVELSKVNDRLEKVHAAARRLRNSVEERTALVREGMGQHG